MYKICFIVESDFTNFYRERWKINYFKKNKTKVEILNVSKITRPGYFDLFNKIFDKKQKIITDNNLENNLERIKSFDLVFLLIDINKKAKKIIEILDEKKIPYSLVNFAPLPLPVKGLFEIFFQFLKHPLVGFIKTIEFLTREKININLRYIFYAGKVNYLDLKKKFKKSKLVNIPSFDYDRLIIHRRKKNKDNKRKNLIATFVSGNHLSPDQIFTDKKFPPEENAFDVSAYYDPINSFLIDFHKITKLQLNIAQHPKQIEKKKYYKFGKVTRGKTFELVKNSEIIIGQSSTAIGCAIMLFKPVIFITNSNFTYQTKKGIYFFAKYFNKKPFDVAREKFDKKRYIQEKKVDYKFYSKFIKEFIIHKKGTMTSNEIFLKTLRSMR